MRPLVTISWEVERGTPEAMSYTRFVRGTLDPTVADPCAADHDRLHKVRRHRGLPRGLTARHRPALARQKNTGPSRRAEYQPRLANVHDFGDGRHALEFDGPSIDLMLYHDEGVTIAEWVTVDGELIRLVAVGDC